ncbi:hypothetical protein HPB50_018340 [Hyalomma asiaticum]|uniref:Uncharacterized protein n=1 Tax=Hyalomma asiaticum TaxID=266040 RepID=A0ACB7RLH9_HYAAI|nr:hypothetical protein HPB50_018340 [Hyalomma asiaticum]
MLDLGRVYRFRDHPIAGVNWRPTRFVDEVPSSRACGLCRMIPRSVVLLPCAHALCQSCHVANAQGARGGRCPLDQEPFEEAECSSYDLPARKASLMTVYCWNEVHGCKFEGTIEEMLRHYENKCQFHAVGCSRCGQGVLHSEVSTHYMAGCRGAVPSAPPESMSSDPADLIFRNASIAFEELKTLLRGPNSEHLLPMIQSQMNELAEAIRNQKPELDHVVEATTPVKGKTVQWVDPISGCRLQEPVFKESPTRETITSSKPGCDSEKTSPPLKPEPFSDLPRSVLEYLRHTHTQEYPQHAFTNYDSTNVKGQLKLTRSLSTTLTWREVLGTVRYVLTLENCDESVLWQEMPTKIAEVTVLHTKDAYFTLGLSLNLRGLYARATFHGMLEGSPCPAPSFKVKAYDWKRVQRDSMDFREEPSHCKHDAGTCVHFRRRYFKNREILKSFGYIRDGKMEFEIKLTRE